MTKNYSGMTVTVHGVLAGAYRGKDISARVTHSHASLDGSSTALCSKRVNLCDMEEPGEPTCPRCIERLAKIMTSANPPARSDIGGVSDPLYGIK